MNKIIVIGCPGAGKSTFARALKQMSDLPLYYLDMIWHKADQSNISREEFDEKLQDIIQKDQWIIDGNYIRTLEMRIQACDTIFLLDFPTDVCLSGVTSRIGKKREDMPWIESKLDEEFKQFILDFSKEQLPEIYHLLNRYQANRKIIIFKSRKEADDYLRKASKMKSSE